MSILKIQTSQNVLLEYDLANIGQRIVAALLDLLLLGLYVWIVNFILANLFSVKLFAEDLNITLFIFVTLPLFLYQPVIEYLWNGKTLGKHFLKIKVVRMDGTSASLGDFVLRWLLRTIDVKLGFILLFFAPRTPASEWERTFIILFIIFMIIPFPLVGILSMAFSKACQRIGDRIANTVVIKRVKPYSLDDTILKTTQRDYEPRYKNVLKLSDRDIYIIKNVLEDFNKTRDYKNIIEVAAKARELLDIHDDVKDRQLLRILLIDYNYLGKKEREKV